MATNGRRKDSEIQAADGPPDPELESLIAPQGYDPELVDDVATLETPAQQQRSAIKFFVIMVALAAVGFWLCTPADLVIPEPVEPPYGIDQRPLPPANKFLENAIPRIVEEFKLVDVKKEQVFAEPYVGQEIVRATYIDKVGNPVNVVVLEAESYINARRVLENYKKLLEQQATITEWQERLYIEQNFIRWAAPGFADRAYGLAWNNDRYFIAITSPIREAQEAVAAAFPY